MGRTKNVTDDTAAVAAAEVKETGAKKTTAKKTAAKKAETPKEETVLTEAKVFAAKDVLEAATKAYMEANPEGEIRTMDLYVKPDEDVAYYAVNGEGREDYKIQL